MSEPAPEPGREHDRHPAPAATPPTEPGEVAAPDATTEGVDASVSPSGDDLERVAESGVGPGAGETDLVRVTTPRDVRREDIARPPTLHED
jgi:hypothetical protein